MSTDMAITLANDLPVERTIEEWLYTVQNTNSGSLRTVQEYRAAFTSYIATLEGYHLDIPSATVVDLSRVLVIWASQRRDISHTSGPVANSTYNYRLSVVSSYFSFLANQYDLPIRNPATRIKRRPVQSYAHAIPLAAEDVTRMMAAIDTSQVAGFRDYMLIALGLLTGRRASELVGVRWGSLRRAGTRWVFEFHCKGNKIKRNTLTEGYSELFDEYLAVIYPDHSRLQMESPIWPSFSPRNRGQAVSTHTLNDLCAKHLGTTKIHTLRHSFAKQMLAAKASVPEISEALGHENLQVTSRYLKDLASEEENPYAAEMAKSFGIGRVQREEN